MENNIGEEIMIDEKQARSSKIFFIIFGLIIAGSVFATFYRTVIAKNYAIEAQTDCDPYTQKCFIWECDPASNVEGEKCTGDAQKDTWYYRLIERNASRIPLCDPTDKNCKALECADNEPDCKYIYCDGETKVAQKVECSDPVEYTKENPPKEESDSTTEEVTCEEGDAQCEAEKAAAPSSKESQCAPDDTQCQSDASKDETAPAADATNPAE